MPRDNEGDYEVGYGRPPRHTRFVKGQSGNPRGRPPGAKNLSSLLGEALNETVIVTENGGRRKGHQAPSDHHPTRQPLGHRRFSCDQDPS
jgi:Family of unknown function (DUF5681)